MTGDMSHRLTEAMRHADMGALGLDGRVLVEEIRTLEAYLHEMKSDHDGHIRRMGLEMAADRLIVSELKCALEVAAGIAIPSGCSSNYGSECCLCPVCSSVVNKAITKTAPEGKP